MKKTYEKKLKKKTYKNNNKKNFIYIKTYEK